MIEFKGTPGEWVVEEDEDGLLICMEALAGKDEYLAVYANPDPEKRRADAHVMAASKDLLAMVLQWRSLLRDNPHVRIEANDIVADLAVGEAMLATDAVIAKALGGAS